MRLSANELCGYLGLRDVNPDDNPFKLFRDACSYFDPYTFKHLQGSLRRYITTDFSAIAVPLSI